MGNTACLQVVKKSLKLTAAIPQKTTNFINQTQPSALQTLKHFFALIVKTTTWMIPHGHVEDVNTWTHFFLLKNCAKED